MTRVLHIMGFLDGGVPSLIYSYLKQLQGSGIQFTVLAYKSDSEMAKAMEQRFYDIGVKVIYILPRYEGYWRHFKDYISILKQGNFTSVHCHFGNWSAPYLWLAKKAGIPQRIAHCHTSRDEYSLIKSTLIRCMKGMLDASVTERMACGKKAGDFFWKDKPYTILPNAVDTSQFQFNEHERARIRNELQIQPEETLIGHIGRFSYPKNQEFFLDLLPSLQKTELKIKTVLVGDGEDYERIVESARMQKMDRDILFPGSTSQPASWLCAFDVFVMPSRWEGLPVVSVEAQSSGLPVVFSDRVPEESAVNPGQCRFIALDAPMDEWAEQIVKTVNEFRNQDRILLGRQVEKNGFDIVSNAKKLADLYEKFTCGIRENGTVNREKRDAVPD